MVGYRVLLQICRQLQIKEAAIHPSLTRIMHGLFLFPTTVAWIGSFIMPIFSSSISVVHSDLEVRLAHN